jgi:23S rRNA (uracil1939-C5)-methyltransferase
MRAPRLELDLLVTELAPGGSGVAHAEIEGERRAVFVRHAAPGDRLRAEVDTSQRPARAKVRSIVSAGADRVPSPCAWSERCGGCDWMHLSLEAQARVHAQHLRAALPPAWREAPIESHSAPAAIEHRIRARVHVRAARGGRPLVGMHEAGTHEPVEVDRCAVLHPALEAARARLGELLAGCRGRGEVQMALGAGRLPVLEIRWDGDVAPEVFGRLEAAVASGVLAGAGVLAGEVSRPATIGDPAPWMAGPDGEALRLAPGGFGQATEPMNAVLAKHVASLVSRWHPAKAVELYAGAGNLSVLLAREVGELACVESHRGACAAARANLSERGLGSVARVVEADADAYVWSPATRLVVLDPPRTGARAVAERLAAARTPQVVYVSCDLATLGRDLGLLADTHAPVSVASFEMFPGTSHVEAVVTLERAPAGGRKRAPNG